MPYTAHGDTRLYYESHGEGQPLVLIMGLGGSIQAWGLQIPRLCRRYRVIAMDNRGAGRSDAPDAPYSIELMADDRAWPVANARLLARRIPGAELAVLQHAAHMLMVEQPHRFNAAVMDFIDRQGQNEASPAGADNG